MALATTAALTLGPLAVGALLSRGGRKATGVSPEEVERLMATRARKQDLEQALLKSQLAESGVYGKPKTGMSSLEALYGATRGGQKASLVDSMAGGGSVGDKVAQHLGFRDIQHLMKRTQGDTEPMLGRLLRQKESMNA